MLWRGCFVHALRSLSRCFHIALKVSDSQNTELGSDDHDQDLTRADDVKRALEGAERSDRGEGHTKDENGGTYWDW